jgi:hypothetical protein
MFILIRYILILATGAIAFTESAARTSPMPVAVLILLALASNLVLGQVSPFSFFDATMQAPILVADTGMISVALLLSRAGQEFFLFFFFMLIMAAKVENLVLLALGALLIGFTSFLMADPGGGWLTPALMRIPFLLATGLFFGYVVLPERTGQMMPMVPQRPAPRRRPLSMSGAVPAHLPAP